MPTALRKERNYLNAIPALQFGGELRLVAHLLSYREVRNVHRIKIRLHLQPGVTERWSLILDGHTSHAQGYQFFTRPAEGTGLLLKIPFDGALGLATPHFT